MKIINQIINIYLCEIKKIYDGFEDNTIINIILFEMANFNYKEKNFYFHLINSNDKYKEIKNQLILFNDKTKIMSHIYKEENGQLFEDLIKNKFSKQLIKKIKDHLRHIYFMFQTKHYNKINTLFETFKNELINNQEIKLNNLLSVHSSTYERKNFYEEFYNKINEFVNLNECESIMDLGCGFNPFSYTYFNLNNKKLYLNELNTNDLNILKRLSQVYKLKFNTNTKIIEKNIFEIEKFEKVDICFLLKILQTLEYTKRNFTKKLIENINAKYLIVSFSTQSLSGRKIYSNREWFEKIINKYKYETFEIFNEIIYIITK